ncbi:hypothetical protein IQ230_15130 [Gloeocapsopsis crepidinum LEGE 06123]|uniref:Uncharacterized protein n=1 Tax=Gloeocapsopsis crepidinum LEGE 06123 TaxID=588587 RepID=A0ABR9UTQ3_9CHRO|nr:hypothetical protein [Gloeocapsopsis crepidinum]MBE9191657.1 hypothetical protein [Gloeocapsopsis crepidinum LEGE 06123]
MAAKLQAVSITQPMAEPKSQLPATLLSFLDNSPVIRIGIFFARNHLIFYGDANS